MGDHFRVDGREQAPIVQAMLLDDITAVEAFRFNDNNNNLADKNHSNFVDEAAWPQINEGQARSFLSEHQWPSGLQDTLIRNMSRIPIRYFVCDDSGSMATCDGHQMVTSGRTKKLISCTRWSEMVQSLKFHAALSVAACAVSDFRFLNGEKIRLGGADSHSKAQIFNALLEGTPGGGTPLCKHIREITAEIRLIAPSLRSNNQKACIIIMTDGESSDGNLADAMRPLRELPVWVVVRLCTDDDRTVNYWNNIDNDLEIDMDVLDDLQGECEEVIEKNPWLTYGEPMHRLREFGIPIKEIDLLDEAKLSKDQMRTLVAAILGGKVDSYPHPDVDWGQFLSSVSRALDRTPLTWCPHSKSMRPWVVKNKLAAVYHGSFCVVS